MDDEEVVEDEELPEGLDSIVPTSALSLRRRGDGIRVFEEEGNLKESGFGRKDFGDLEESRGVGCGEKLEMPFARRDAIVVVAMRRDVQGEEDCFFFFLYG